MVERQGIAEFTLPQVVLEVVEVRLRKVVELRLHPDKSRCSLANCIAQRADMKRKGNGVLGRVANTLELPELFAAKQVDVHVDALLHGGDICKYAANVEERLDVALAQNGCETLARCREAGETAAHLGGTKVSEFYHKKDRRSMDTNLTNSNQDVGYGPVERLG